MVKKIKSLFKKKNANRISPDQLSLHQTAYLMADDQDESMTSEKGMADSKSLKILYSYARPFRLQILFALSLIFVSSIMAIYSSKLMGDLLEKGLMVRDMHKSIVFAVSIVLLEIGSIFFIWTGRKRLAVSASQVIFNVRKSLFSKLQDLPMQYYDRQPQGRIVTRVTHDVEGIEEFFTSSLGNLISASMMTILAVAAMIVSNFKLGTVMTLSIIPSIILILKTKDFLRTSNRRVSKFSSAINAKLSENLNGMETIRSYGLEKWSMKKYAHTCDDYLFAQLKGNMLFAFAKS